MKRNVSVPLLPALGCAAAVIGFVFLCDYVLSRPPAGTRAEQDRIVAAIETFRDRHGRLPDSLKEAGVGFDQSVFDSVYYLKAFTSPNSFDLSCNKYYWSPAPSIHWWYYSSANGVWEYKTEGI
jgi:hypothetical protein